jgi:hypothetical protein
MSDNNIFEKFTGLAKDAFGAATNMGQELLIDVPKFIAGRVSGNHVAAEKARRAGVKHGKQGLKNFNNVLKNSAIDEVIAKVPFGEKVRGPVTQGLDKLDGIFEKEMIRQGIIPGDKPASNAADIVFERAAPTLPNVPKAAGITKKALQHCA